MQKLKTFLKEELFDWRIQELTLLILATAFLLVLSLYTGPDPLALACSLLLVFGIILSAKGKAIATVVNLASILLYSVVSWQQHLYGELIVSYLLMVPLCIYSIISWFRNRNHQTQTIEVNSLNVRQTILPVLGGAFITIPIFFLLRAFNTPRLLLSTGSVFISMMATYFEARRSRTCYVFYLINDVVLITLWGLIALGGELSVLVIAAESAVNLFLDTYGITNWKRIADKQKSCHCLKAKK